MECTKLVCAKIGVYPLVEVWVLFSPVMAMNCGLGDAWDSGFARTKIVKVVAFSPSRRIITHPTQCSVGFMGTPVAYCALALSSALTQLESSHGCIP